ncbi:Dihydropteroate synthase [Metschnikowia bicuspidata var. bicuspidata NRRL YB-4993]|uniref:Dihydropteroate synthase n=1 Tax=Metschnikowia bicuspidata var. bicuspidata NRRL YB-4993 TaxID=869754 RepID=A0A1A0HJE9_9ASCO|nr:Dihydropteroate synthase [Metschnikowia bicuspidata var. bicuspidata NRRL YB-4993]OBA24012.1 Dihydropteroate synthase [Metschnikowia bicuspidata var. bicuspidata NRRL YB-4993]
MSDKVHISGLEGKAIVGLDHWQKPVPHPVFVDVDFATDFSRASETDNLHYSLNYAVISSKIATFLEHNQQRNFQSLGGLGSAILGDVLAVEKAVSSSIQLKISAPKVDIRAPVSFSTSTQMQALYQIQGLRALTLIGVFTFERLNKQYVLLDIDLNVSEPHLNVARVSESVSAYLESANFKTVEALVALSCQWIFQNFPTVNTAGVRVTKPNAIVYTQGVGVSCFYARADFENKPVLSLPETGRNGSSENLQPPAFDLPVETTCDYSGKHNVYIAFGSNEGDQIENISTALRLLNNHPQISVKGSSSLYVSKPMYYTDQPDFYNGAALLQMQDLSPHDLLHVLKDIEYKDLGRVKDFDNCPRSIDLDIVLFDRMTVTSPDLVVPHKAMLDRTFVLQPLCELLPPDFTHPVTAEPIHNHLAKSLAALSDPEVQELPKLVLVTPGTGGRRLKFNHDGTSPSALMAIFNVTPDLFSDGGARLRLTKDEIVAEALRMKENGAQIIDVGGVSTRPGSSEPPLEEELSRVLPVVEAIRSEPRLDDVLVSVDTYRAGVAEKVLDAGADIINDISMGLYDSEIFKVVANHGCGYVMNHTRGTPATMSKLTTYGPADPTFVEYNIDESMGMMPLLESSTRNLLNGVCRELADQLKVATENGVRKWQVIIDPGIGFAKDLGQNLHIIRHGRRFKKYAQVDLSSESYTSFHGMAVLMGTSRKRFLGTLTGQDEAKLRVISSAASVVACVEQGADIVRVHDVKEVKEALQVADAIYKSAF